MTAIRPRTPLLAIAAIVALALTGCTGTDDPAPSATASASAPSTTPPPSPTATSSAAPSTEATPVPSGSASGATAQYLGFVQQFSPTLAALQPAVLVGLGRQVCTDFGRGRDAGQVAVALGDSSAAPDLQATDAAVIIGAAVATLCPRYRSKLEG